jgi:hypothetical protein
VPDKLDADIDRLYGLPLEEFTPARDELAKSLRAHGDREAAAEIKKLRKPTVAAWALNQAQRREPKRVAELIDAGARLRDAQQRLVAGGERGLLIDAAAEERRLAEQVVALGEQQLAGAGHGAGATAQSKLWSTVRAAAVNPEAGELLESGRLTRDYEVSDLGLGDAGALSAPPAAVAKKKPSPPRERPADRAERKQAERKAQAIRRALDKARTQHETAKDRAAEARIRAKDAQREAARAASALERAQAAAEQAEARAKSARSRVAELEEELRELDA